MGCCICCYSEHYQLIEYCGLGNEPKVREILASPTVNMNIVINVKKGGKEIAATPLLSAVSGKQQHIVTLLLSLPNIDVNVSHVEKKGFNPLIAAVAVASDEILSQLLNHPDIDVNYQTDDGNTALWWSIIFDNSSIVKKLLAHPKIDVNLCWSSKKVTPLIGAIRAKRFDAAKLLLTHPKIDVNWIDDNGQSALDVAICEGQLDIIKILLEDHAVDIITVNSPICPLIIASGFGHVEAVKYLISNPVVDINIADEEKGYTPLILATISRQEEIVRILLDHPNIQVNLKDKENKSACIYAHNIILKMITSHHSFSYDEIDRGNMKQEGEKWKPSDAKSDESDPMKVSDVLQIAGNFEPTGVLSSVGSLLGTMGRLHDAIQQLEQLKEEKERAIFARRMQVLEFTSSNNDELNSIRTNG